MHFTPVLSKPALIRWWRDVPQRPSLGPILFFFRTMFKSVMFIYSSLCYSVIAASGKGPSLLRVLSSLQKVLLSQERDGRLNNQFPITVTMWEQLFASEGLPAIVCGSLKQRRKEKRHGGEERWKESFFLLDSALLRVVILISATDVQMYVQRHVCFYLHPSVDTHVSVDTY